MKKNIFIKACAYSFIYVGLGTLAILSLDRSFILHGDWAFLALLITMPVSFIGFGYVYMEKDFLPEVYYIQFVVFLIFALVVYAFLSWHNKKVSVD